jgi:hypothetical protein
MKNAVFWDVTQRGSCKNRSFGVPSVLTRATGRIIAEDRILQEVTPFSYYMKYLSYRKIEVFRRNLSAVPLKQQNSTHQILGLEQPPIHCALFQSFMPCHDYV